MGFHRVYSIGLRWKLCTKWLLLVAAFFQLWSTDFRKPISTAMSMYLTSCIWLTWAEIPHRKCQSDRIWSQISAVDTRSAPQRTPNTWIKRLQSSEDTHNHSLLVTHDKMKSWCTYWDTVGNKIQPVKAKDSKNGHLQNNISRNKTNDIVSNGNLMLLVTVREQWSHLTMLM